MYVSVYLNVLYILNILYIFIYFWATFYEEPKAVARYECHLYHHTAAHLLLTSSKTLKITVATDEGSRRTLCAEQLDF